MIDKERIEKIKRNLDFRSFIEDHADGIKGTPPQLSARCPGHEDSSPSLSVNVESGLWMCHAGCGAGDVLDFCQQILQLSFMESVEYLERYLEDPTKTVAGKPRLDRAAAPAFEMTPTLKELLEKARATLALDGPWKERLTTRGISAEVAAQFGLAVGLQGDLELPMLDLMTGRVRGVRCRFLNGDIRAEAGSRPSETLYGRFEVGEPTFVCEGEMDVLAMLSAGCKSAVGVLGAEMSWRPEWSERLKDAPAIFLCADDDEAGRRMNEQVRAALVRDGITPERIATIDWPRIHALIGGRAERVKDLNDALMAGVDVCEVVRGNSTEAGAITVLDSGPDASLSVDGSGNFPWESLPQLFQTFAEATRGRRQIADAYWIAGLLSVAGFAIGRHAYSLINGLAVYPSQLNVAIAEQSTGKSDMLKVIGRIARTVNPQGVQSGAPDSAPGLLRILQKSPELLLCIDEFAGLLKSLQTSAQYRNNKLPEHLKSAYEGVDCITRAVAASTSEVRDPQMSIIAIATPDVISPLQIPRAWFRDGLASRITFWKAPGRDFVRTPEPFDQKALDSVGKALGDLRTKLTSGGATREYRLDKGAKESWHALVDWQLNRRSEARGDEVMEGLVARLPGKAERIALIFACVDGATSIERLHVEGAAALTRWLFEAARELFKNYGSSRSDHLYDLVLDRMKEKFSKCGASTEELWRSSHRYFKERSELLEILNLAVRYGTLTSKASTRGTRYMLQEGATQSDGEITDAE